MTTATSLHAAGGGGTASPPPHATLPADAACGAPRRAPSRGRRDDGGSVPRCGRRPPAPRDGAAGRNPVPRGRRPVGRRGGDERHRIAAGARR